MFVFRQAQIHEVDLSTSHGVYSYPPDPLITQLLSISIPISSWFITNFWESAFGPKEDMEALGILRC